MNRLIKVRPPKNLSREDRHLFEPFLTYELAPMPVKRFKDVYVAYTGYSWDSSDVMIKESHHDFPEKFETFLKEVTYFQMDIIRSPENLIRLDATNTYLQIHHPWFNYYHWLCEPILRQWLVRERSRDMILILPDYYGKVDYIMSSLEPFQFKEIFFIPAGKCLFVEDLWMPAIKPICDSYHYKEMKEIRQFYLKYVKEVKKLNIDAGERVYISRSKAARRRVLNEDEVIGILKEYGFTIVQNEDYNFFEQIALYSNVRYLVSIHGAGMTNMIFMKEDSVIFEMHKKKTKSEDWHSLAFWYLAECFGYDYYQQVCMPGDPADSFFDADFVVDLDLFRKNIELIFM